jgi:hypothetical protein
MAVRELSATRTTLWASDTEGASERAHRASESILFGRQTSAIQGQRESSTEFHGKGGLCRQAQGEGDKRPCLSIFWGKA